jgi:hypothetical protein
MFLRNIVHSQKTRPHNDLEDHNLLSHRRENLKSHEWYGDYGDDDVDIQHAEGGP